MNHLTLTDDELKEVAEFWGNWIRSGGEGEEPTAFQLEALNDFRLRDAWLFWQVGGTLPEDAMGPAFPKAKVAYDLLGPSPTDFDLAMKAGADLMAIMNRDVEADDIDTGTVVIFAFAIWSILLGKYQKAQEALAGLALANLKYAALKMTQHQDTSGILHRDPLSALTHAATTIGRVAATDSLRASDLARECFCVADGSPAHAFILAYAIRQKEREYQNESR